MENSIYLGLSRQMALQHNMDIIANNVANINTPGYRGQNLLFREYISDPLGSDDPISFVEDIGQYDITSPGPVRVTGNDLDVSLEGPGFIGISGPGGKTVYTRAGNFSIAPDGALITASGFALAGQSGGDIVLPNDATEVNIDGNGVVSTQNGTIGRLKIIEFDNPQSLTPIGNNLYETTESGTAATKTRVSQGQVEGSNVQPVVEMTRMIDTLRSFQSMQQVMQSENERLRTAIQRLTRAG